MYIALSSRAQFKLAAVLTYVVVLQERRQHGVQKHTVSLWTYVNSRRELFLNPLYHSEPDRGRAIFPQASVRYMRLWTGYYCKWNPRMRPQDSVRQRQTQLLAMKVQQQ
jgi:myotubularin-related protein 1/2